MMHYSQILLKPVISEKGTLLKEEKNQVTFLVHKDANKSQIKSAVEEAFGVQVKAVNVVVKKPLAKYSTVAVNAFTAEFQDTKKLTSP